MDKDRAHNYIEQHEGRRHVAYADSEGIPTVGVGFNLQKENARERIEQLELDYEAVCGKRCSLTDAHVNRLFAADVYIATTDAVSAVPNFWDHPEDVQLAIVDMIFNLGKTRFLQFVNFIAALKDKDYMRAADEMANSKWARQVPSRAADDIALVRGCAE